jgi:hypothetical protein
MHVLPKIAIVIATAGCLGVVAALLWPAAQHTTRGKTVDHGGDEKAPPEGGPPRPAIARVKMAAASHQGVETRPGAAGYDPSGMQLAGVPSRSVFEAEPRDPGWASAIEASYAPQVAADLAVMLPGVAVQGLECRTNTCELKLELPESDLGPLMGVLSLVAYGDVNSIEQTSTKEGRTMVSQYVTFQEHREPDAHARWYASNRRLFLSRARPGEGRLAGVARLPTE